MRQAPSPQLVGDTRWPEVLDVAASLVDQVDTGEIPARVADPDLAQVPPRRRELVAHALCRDSGVEAAHRALAHDPEGVAQLDRVRTGPGGVRAVAQTPMRRDAELAMHTAVIILLKP